MTNTNSNNTNINRIPSVYVQFIWTNICGHLAITSIWGSSSKCENCQECHCKFLSLELRGLYICSMKKAPWRPGLPRMFWKNTNVLHRVVLTLTQFWMPTAPQTFLPDFSACPHNIFCSWTNTNPHIYAPNPSGKSAQKSGFYDNRKFGMGCSTGTSRWW